jgi:hypothetical protein
MENKTAMNTLIETLKLHEVLMEECPEIIDIIEIFFTEVEKSQIKHAWENGMKSDNGHFGTSEEYYNQTYTNENL